jgi:predicted HTH domain antitoxin
VVDSMEKQVEKDIFQASLKSLIAAGLYQSEDEILQDALSCLLKSNPEYKLKIAMYRYQTEEISVGKAAEIAGISMETMKRYLVKNGVMPRFAPENMEEARKDYQTIRGFLER